MTEAPLRQTFPTGAYSQPVEACLAALDARPEGLAGTEAARRLAEHGANRLPEARARGPALRFLLQFHNVLIYVLLGAAAVTALLQHWVDTGVILAVVLANATIGFIQEGKAEAAMAAIRGMLAPRAAVLRDGGRVTIDGADLVPGDIVLMEAGDKVPADLRLIEARGLAAQEAILTGESVPVEKGIAPVDAAAALGDRRSMLWSGKVLIERWRRHYNTIRPHSALGYRPPAPDAILPRPAGPAYAPLRHAQPGAPWHGPPLS